MASDSSSSLLSHTVGMFMLSAAVLHWSEIGQRDCETGLSPLENPETNEKGASLELAEEEQSTIGAADQENDEPVAENVTENQEIKEPTLENPETAVEMPALPQSQERLVPRPSNPLLFFGMSPTRLKKSVLNEVISRERHFRPEISYVTHGSTTLLLEVLEAIGPRHHVK